MCLRMWFNLDKKRNKCVLDWGVLYNTRTFVDGVAEMTDFTLKEIFDGIRDRKRMEGVGKNTSKTGG